MNIVNKEDFLRLPEGTVYSRYTPHAKSGAIEIRGSVMESGDWFYQELGNCFIGDDSNEHFSAMEMMLEHWEHHSMEECILERDGLFEDEAHFLIYSKEDVKKLIQSLFNTL